MSQQRNLARQVPNAAGTVGTGDRDQHGSGRPRAAGSTAHQTRDAPAVRTIGVEGATT